MKEALIHSKITFELILKNWILTDKQRIDIKSNIDYLNEVLTIPVVVRQSGQLCECGGSERVALDCTMKPCKHPKYFKE